MKYISTRGGGTPQTFKEVLLMGLAPDGGLFVPSQWPKLDTELKSLSGASYSEIAQAVTKPFVEGEIKPEIMRQIFDDVYGHFGHTAVAPLVQIGPNQWIMELFHGPTLAFKDYALQVLGRLFDHVLDEMGEKVTIVGATSGDTGSAAIEACKGCKNINIFILHPEGRTSEVQRRQMTTVHAPNVFNIALKGTFDDCQNMVKAMFNDLKFRSDMNLSAVNSINWARIMTQIVYYVSASLSLGAGAGRGVSFAVPTGNFGNIYAAYCAKNMGLPIQKLIIGSNRNDILTRFFQTGTMKSQMVEPSLSPSMDIQISSNFERYLFNLYGQKGAEIVNIMNTFMETGAYTVDEKKMAPARRDFEAHRCSDEQTREMMAQCYKDTGYILDPHTAVGLHAGLAGQNEKSVPLVALACAHPAKFPDAVEKAIGIRPALPAHLADLYDRKEYVTVLDNDLPKVQDFVRSGVK